MNTPEYKCLLSQEIIEKLKTNNITDYMAVVYMFEDIVTSLCYVGTTIHFHQRLTEHIYDARTVADNRKSWFYNIVRKYGWDRFNVYILEAGLTQSQGLRLEKKWIKWLDSFHNGYNMTEGGTGFTCGENSPQAVKIRGKNIDTGYEMEWNWIGGAAQYLGVINQNIQMVLQNRNQQAYNFDNTERWMFKYKDDISPWNYPKSKYEGTPIILRNIDTNDIKKFVSCSQAGKELDIQKKSILNALHQKQNQVFSQKTNERYEVHFDPPIREYDYNIPLKEDASNISVIAYTKEGKYFSQYKSAAEASRILGIHRGHICESMRHTKWYIGGLFWEYEDLDLRAKQQPRKKLILPRSVGVYYIQNNEKISFESQSKAVASFPNMPDRYRKDISYSISKNIPCRQGFQWYKL